MRGQIGLLCSAGFFGLFAIANAQTSSPPTTSTQFDGAYALAASTKVNEGNMTVEGRTGRCQTSRQRGRWSSLTVRRGAMTARDLSKERLGRRANC